MQVIKLIIFFGISSLNVLVSGQTDKVTGPYYIPDWTTPDFQEGSLKGKSDVVVYQESLEATIFSARAWRYVWRWKFLNRHISEINSYVIIPGTADAIEWLSKRNCKVGKTYISSREDDCWEDLDTIKKEEWINPRVLKVIPPDTRPYMSTCSLYYSCDIHDVTFPIYISKDKFEPFISGPHGENIQVSGDGSIKVIRMEDSFLVFKSIKKILVPSQMDTGCLWSGVEVENADLICNFQFDEHQVTLEFKGGIKRTIFNNIVFYRPILELPKLATLRNDADAATKGDLAQLQVKLMLVMKDILFSNHQLQQELANIKHILKALILSTAKLDDNLIGKIARVPVRTKWLNDEVFLLSSSLETIIHNAKLNSNNSCLGSYKYENGRWSLVGLKDSQCSNWNSTTPLKIMHNMLQSPLEVLNAPEYRNSSGGYSGWTFLDNGRVSLDWLDKGLKYHDKGSGFDFNLDGLNLMQILMMVAYIIIAIVVVSLVTTILKTLKS